MQVMTPQQGAAAPAPLPEVQAAPAPSIPESVTTVQFGQRLPQFSGDAEKSNRKGIGGFFSWISRVFNRFVLGRHEAEDKKMRDNPIPYLTEERNQVVEEFNTVERDLAGVIADRDIALEELEDLVKAEAKEKNEAAAARQVQKETSEEDAEYEAQSEYAALQAREWQAAKAEREAKEAQVERLNLRADEAEERLKQFKARVDQLVEEMDEAKRLHNENVADERFIAITKKLDVLAGKRIGYSDEGASLMADIKKRHATNQVLINGGKSEESRVAELRASKRARQVEVQNALDALDEELAADDAKKDKKDE